MSAPFSTGRRAVLRLPGAASTSGSLRGSGEDVTRPGTSGHFLMCWLLGQLQQCPDRLAPHLAEVSPVLAHLGDPEEPASAFRVLSHLTRSRHQPVGVRDEDEDGPCVGTRDTEAEATASGVRDGVAHEFGGDEATDLGESLYAPLGQGRRDESACLRYRLGVAVPRLREAGNVLPSGSDSGRRHEVVPPWGAWVARPCAVTPPGPGSPHPQGGGNHGGVGSSPRLVNSQPLKSRANHGMHEACWMHL